MANILFGSSPELSEEQLEFYSECLEAAALTHDLKLINYIFSERFFLLTARSGNFHTSDNVLIFGKKDHEFSTL